MYTTIESRRRPLQLIVRPGVLPELWRRNVNYFGNISEMFFGNEAQTQEFHRRFGRGASYGGGIVPTLDLMFQGEGRNVLYLERAPDPVLTRYFLALGLSIPRVELLSREDYHDCGLMMELVGGNENRWIDGCVTDDTLEKLARASGKKTVSCYGASRVANNKGVLHAFAEDRGLPVLANFYARTQWEVESALDKLRAGGFEQAMVKAVTGACGIGLKRVSTSSRGRHPIPESFFLEGVCLVQGLVSPGVKGVEEVVSPSVQVFLKDDSVAFFDITEQYLSAERSFRGSECPPSYLRWPEYAGVRKDLLEQAQVVGEWLHCLGLRGPASIDYLVVRSGSGTEAYVCEVNARVSGATFPSLLARHFKKDGAWLMRNLKFSHPMPAQDLLDVLNDHGYLYEAGMARGILPYHLHIGEEGRVEQGQVLVMAPGIEACKELLIEAERGLAIDWHYAHA